MTLKLMLYSRLKSKQYRPKSDSWPELMTGRRKCRFFGE
ncbi:hypothetical protein CAter282_1768 [Collimonas arenae]|uniref:Uncharacterized protein n=1 Tax=Collimonas arenae TaxID=279058 RepID=A0A127QHR7_9BURK|nr:hypothetical protein CAter10_1905 [Collimonas arenae]AMP09544.1 hypothetical protein CAter282_1768 [Collimonas arenae]